MPVQYHDEELFFEMRKSWLDLRSSCYDAKGMNKMIAVIEHKVKEIFHFMSSTDVIHVFFVFMRIIDIYSWIFASTVQNLFPNNLISRSLIYCKTTDFQFFTSFSEVGQFLSSCDVSFDFIGRISMNSKKHKHVLYSLLKHSKNQRSMH